MDIKPVAVRTYDRMGYYVVSPNFDDAEKMFPGREHHPLYPESALTQAREEGRREGMREAKEIADTAAKENESMSKQQMEVGEQLVFAGAGLQAKKISEAIARASEGK